MSAIVLEFDHGLSIHNDLEIHYMDPNTCLNEILDKIFHEDDYDGARDQMIDLQDWLRKGGANPDFTKFQGEMMIDCIAQLLGEVV